MTVHKNQDSCEEDSGGAGRGGLWEGGSEGGHVHTYNRLTLLQAETNIVTGFHSNLKKKVSSEDSDRQV